MDFPFQQWEISASGKSPPAQHPVLWSNGVLVYYSCHNQVLLAGQLKQQKFIVSQFWRPEVQEDVFGRVGSFWGLKVKFCTILLPSFWWFAGNLWHSLVCRSVPWSLPLSSHGIFPLCMSVSKFPLFIRTLVILEYGPPQLPHFNSLTYVKTLSPNKITFWGTGG